MTPRPRALPRLPVLRTLGGCGGTLVARVISALPDVLLLSETNPRSAQLYGGMLNPIEQLRKWHPALARATTGFDTYEIGYPPRFGALLESVYRTALEEKRVLVVRDFNYVDFIGIPFVWPVPNDLSLDAAIGDLFEPSAAVLVRHPADQLASLRSHAAIGPVLEATRFLDAYLDFLRATAGARRFRYEDLVAAPVDAFPSLAAALGLAWDASALSGFSRVEAVTGNLRQRAETKIAPPARKGAAERAERELAGLPAYAGLLSALEYA